MTIPPVILRELRGESRNRMTYWLRLLSAVAVILVFIIVALSFDGNMSAIGSKLFTRTHATIYVMIWLCVPAMTADCIAREKREGTLSLLFLTPLTPGGIALGKSFAHLLRATTLVLAALPILAVPLLMGGVHWIDLVTAFTLEIFALLLSLSAGVYVSSVCKNWGPSLVFAQILGWSLAWMMGAAISCFLYANIQQKNSSSLYELLTFGPLFLSGGFISDIDSWSQLIAQFRVPAPERAWLSALGEATVFAAAAIVFLFLLTVRNIRGATKDSMPSPKRIWLTRIFAAPLFKKSFRRTSNRSLDRNPIGWLEVYRTRARVIKWIWCLAATISVTASITAGDTILFFSVVAFPLSIAFTAASSFRRERENGGLELILVTPLRENQIICGRLFGLLKHFLPALLIFSLPLWFSISNPGSRFLRILDYELLFYVLFAVLLYVTLPLIGLYFSLRLKNFLTATILTCVFSFITPLVGFGIGMGSRRYSDLTDLLRVLICQVLIGVTAWFMLQHNLRRRNFAIGGGLI